MDTELNGDSIEDVYSFKDDIDEENLSQENTLENGKQRSNHRNFRNEISNNQQCKNNEQHECGKCSRRFSTIRGLKKHLRACDKLIMIKEELIDSDVSNNASGSTELSMDSNDHLQLNNLNNTDIYIAELETMKNVQISSFEVNGDLTVKQDPNSLIEAGLCDCCGEDVLTAHTEGEYKCDDCNFIFMKESGIFRHRIMIHNEGDTFSCNKCMVKCPDKKTLTRHLYSHSENAVSCPVCKKIFSRRYHLLRHNLQTGCDGTPKQMFPCQVCQRSFSRKDNLREHLRAHAGQTKRKKNFTCEFCGAVCAGMSVLNQHRKIHTGDKPHGCDICCKRFPTSGAMKKHRRKHTGEKPYECKECNTRFAAKETLNRHIRIHTGYKPHQCVFCGKRFIQASQLRAHIFHHTGENGFKCETCGQAFNRKTRLDIHVKYVHEGAKPYDCSGCDRTFIRKEDMLRHKILHSGVKAHKCPICSKDFAVKASLKIHLLTHTKEPPRSCDECGRAFIRQDCLLRHMRTKHRDKLEEIMAEAEKKKLQAQLLAVASASAADDDESGPSSDLPTYMSDDALTEAISQLLDVLVDEVTMKSFGWPKTTVDKLLECVIRRCGHVPTTMKDLSYAECLRENAKLLFTVVIDDNAVKTLLNNQTVDEVILHVLKLAKT